MSYLLDTNVICESTRKKPDTRVQEWMATKLSEELYLSAISIAEIRKGILLLPEGKRRERLHVWFERILKPTFSGRILDLNLPVLEEWAKLQSEAQRVGKTPAAMDGLIAATARYYGYTVVTRNVGDFSHCGVKCLNPWER